MLKQLSKYPLFWCGLSLKVVLLFFFGSIFLRDLFIPFIDFFVQNPSVNPWREFTPEFFPYGGILFISLALPKYLGYLIFGTAALGQTPLSLALMKAPLLVMDLLLLCTLIKFSPRSVKTLLLFYWLNPVLIYITFIHGQLDLVAMSFTLLALYLLTRQKYNQGAFFLACATLCKFHVAIIFPFVLVYIWKREFIKDGLRFIFQGGLIWCVVTALGFLPILLSGQLFYATVSSPQAGGIFGVQIVMSLGEVFLVGFAIVLIVLGRLCLSTRVTGRGLIFGCGILFGVLLLTTQPMPGWFFWVLPFLCLFYATYYTNHPTLFWVLNGLYLLYYGVIGYTSSPEESTFVSAASFTLMQAFLLGNLAEIWLLVIEPELPVIGSFRPRFFGIAGDSASGKNTLSQGLSQVFGDKSTLVIEGDDYHRWERKDQKWDVYTHLHPRANQLPALSQHTEELMLGRFVMQPRYDHKTGRFSEPRAIKPTRTIIVQGLHTFYLRSLRDRLDMKIFLNPDERVRMSWKVKRDQQERGFDLKKIVESMKKRKIDSEKHINPQRIFADLIIEVYPDSNVSENEILKGKSPALNIRYIVWNDIAMAYFIEALKTTGECQVKVKDYPDDINRVVIEIKGNPTQEQIKNISKKIIPNYRYITRSRVAPKWQPGLGGINQLMVLLLVQNKVSLAHAQNY